jgi:hypothetical protein
VRQPARSVSERPHPFGERERCAVRGSATAIRPSLAVAVAVAVAVDIIATRAADMPTTSPHTAVETAPPAGALIEDLLGLALV